MVYVGMDVHRKRTQVAVLGEDRTQLMNRNVPNDRGSWPRSSVRLGQGRPRSSKRPTAGGGSRSFAAIWAWSST